MLSRVAKNCSLIYRPNESSGCCGPHVMAWIQQRCHGWLYFLWFPMSSSLSSFANVCSRLLPVGGLFCRLEKIFAHLVAGKEGVQGSESPMTFKWCGCISSVKGATLQRTGRGAIWCDSVHDFSRRGPLREKSWKFPRFFYTQLERRHRQCA